MQTLNAVLGASTLPEPPMCDIDGVAVKIRVRRMPNMHTLTPRGANQEEDEETRLPPPEQPILIRHIEGVAENLGNAKLVATQRVER